MPWPFRKRRDVAGDRRGAVAAGVTGAPRRDWAELPPLRPASRPLAPASAPQRFTASLASRQPLVRPPSMTHVRIVAPTGSAHDWRTPTSGPSPVAAVPATSPRPGAPAVTVPARVQHGSAAVEHLLSLPAADETSDAADGGRIAGESGPADPRPADPARVELDPPDPAHGASPALPGGPDDVPGLPGARRSLADSRRRGLGPAYHGSLPEAVRAERRRVAAASEPVPPGVGALVRDALGVDVGDRLVHRGPAVTAEARAMGARAFVRAEEVYVGDDVGPLDTAEGRATVAHELTHVAQQQLHASLPPEGSAEDLMLEAQAQRVEQYVRGDAAAPKPPPALVHARPTSADDVVADSQQLMRDLIDRGLARPDGSGGVVFGVAAPPAAAGAGVQRLVAPAPHAGGGATQPEPPGRDSAAHSGNWNAADTWGHGLGSALANDMLTIGGSFLGLSDDVVGAERDRLSAEDRRFAQDQTRSAYREMRLEHLQQRELRQLHEHQDSWHEPRSDHLSEAVMTELRRQVDDEMRSRSERLEQEKQRALAEINAAHAQHGQPPARQVAGPSEDRAFHLLFDHPNADVMPSAEELHTALIAELAEADRARPASPPAPGAPGGTAAAAGSPPGAVHASGSPAGAGSSSTATQATAPPAPTPSSATAPPTGAPGTPGGHAAAGDDALQRGEHWRRIGAERQQQRMWSGESTTSVGENLSSLGRTLVGDVLHQETEFLGSFFGFDDSTQTELDHGIDRDLSIAPADRTAAGAAESTARPGAPHDTPAPAATGGATSTAAGAPATSHADEAARQTVDRLARDPYALDELALRLYPNIRSRLRHELLVDRERAGLLTDFR